MAATRVVTSVAERRDVILEVICRAKREIALSLFRCNDAAVFAAITDAVHRGVAVHALVTSRAKGGQKKLKKLWDALEQTGYDGYVTFEYFHPFLHYPEALIEQSSGALDRILGRTLAKRVIG